jgi:hypothetical protein
MTFTPPALMQKTIVPLLVVCLLAFGGSAFQAVMAHRLATEIVEAYAPKIEKQAVALIVEALPKDTLGKQAAHLAQVLATNVESQYSALSRAVESQASALAYQTFSWAVASILALLAVIESRRKVPGAA